MSSFFGLSSLRVSRAWVAWLRAGDVVVTASVRNVDVICFSTGYVFTHLDTEPTHLEGFVVESSMRENVLNLIGGTVLSGSNADFGSTQRQGLCGIPESKGAFTEHCACGREGSISLLARRGPQTGQCVR